ncbi:hypothetical protein VOLCADRAFT_96484 [Volvox carteri f. nagariensis]|uniref:Uncharacterized protein n=1 Tax=Volvox carteri f. nagariensis TaxID=3068 RepID=D8UA85_VOLCA|nr:uncharacterized protein VOLCADRAFT_96484 [Volvox carteri f. nagariensis]EFJ43379.1 hypothetical protein VOLCADRAFT_96484 [Volvox carteri f. nagariensis]|eukprot:XP_002955526.1 hypothetical protein VOLCADRAFT_96484 [Volvox carteri f. nagariensis]
MDWLSLRAPLEAWLKSAGAAKFSDEDLRVLWQGGYNMLDDLKVATRASLERAGLRPARVDQILNTQGADAGTSNTAAAAATAGPGIVADDPYKMTAHGAMMRMLPPINLRSSPCCSFSKTCGTRSCTFSAVKPWDSFLDELKMLEGQLDDNEQRFIPVLLAGDQPTDQGFQAAADEAEVRAPMQAMAQLVNSVAASMHIQGRLKGGGSGRGISSTDYIIQLRHGDIGQQKQQQYNSPSWDVYGCIEVKGDWQFPLEAHYDVSCMPLGEINRLGLGQALQQCYGDMVMDEAPLGMVTRHNLALLLKRSPNVADKTLYVSPVIGLDKMLLVLLFLLQQADLLEGMKKLLPREAVPITPGQGDNSKRELKRCQSLRLQEQRQMKQWSVLPGQGKVPGGLEQLTRKRGSKVLLPLELCGFGDVGLTGRCAGYGCYGSMLEGTIGGVAAVIKLFEQKRQGAMEAFTRELAVYLRLGSSISSNSSSNLQGALLVPRLLRYGMFAHSGALFLALTYEGDDLEAGAGRSTTVVGDAAASGSRGCSLQFA